MKKKKEKKQKKAYHYSYLKNAMLRITANFKNKKNLWFKNFGFSKF